MIELSSRLEGKTFVLYELESEMKPLGYDISGNWEYDHGYFDYKIDDSDGYQFLRIPFRAVDGQLDSNGTTVELQKPFLLSHQYQDAIDDEGNIGNISAAFNQFQEPKNPDAEFPENYIGLGKSLVHDLEKQLLDQS
ncbi:hypothetical protein ELQ35_18940 [Peribacillus cavernae]|uniref:YugN-like family protein n=1 Tax=Peribacillus cavernae TaxID=1674310 RepID=A0A3S0VJ35_9BACI|nr:YugN-like family protein [Peribacillus cavernae]MDQ0219608.1 hypothetical protein [Peribacillus cavernae]RUQ25896.1 hypothetical protein ELQ35_18940 [Peribacillus cavernae]